MRCEVAFVFIVAILLTIPLSHAETSSASCLQNCESKFGNEDIYRTSWQLSSDTISLCGGQNTPAYLQYKSCKSDIQKKFDGCKATCQNSVTAPCSDVCEQTYNSCLLLCSYAWCEDVYVDSCKTPTCLSQCSHTWCEDNYLVSCKATCNEECAPKKVLACVSKACALVDSALYVQKSQCTGKNVGDACCEQPKAGDTTIYVVEKRENEVQRDVWGLSCSWKKYEWQSVAPYDIQLCKYNWDKKITKKVLVDSGTSSGFIAMLLCDFVPEYQGFGTYHSGKGSEYEVPSGIAGTKG